MAGTSHGSEKVARTMRNRYGVDANGKSLFHQKIGRDGGAATAGKHLRSLDPEQLREFSLKGVAAKKLKAEGKNGNQDSGRSSNAE